MWANLIPATSLDNNLDLGIVMSSNCYFEFHINRLCKQCTDVSGWIKKTLLPKTVLLCKSYSTSSDLSRINYGSQLWQNHSLSLPHKIIIIIIVYHIRRRRLLCAQNFVQTSLFFAKFIRSNGDLPTILLR